MEKTKKNKIKLFIKCDNPNYSDQWICENNVLWRYMGRVHSHTNIKDAARYAFLYVLEIDISLRKNGLILSNFHDDKEFADVEMSTPDGKISVHKEVLAAHSDIFRTVFGGKWKETTEDSIEVEGATLQSLQHLKNYMYLGILPKDGLRELLVLAKRYLIEDLKAECILHLSRSVTPDTLFDLLEYASKSATPELTLAIIRNTPNQVVKDVELLLKNPRVNDDTNAK